MARSTYIYVVLDWTTAEDLKAAFTVKHELVRWLKKQLEIDDVNWQLNVYRVRDNDPVVSPERMDMFDLVT